MFHYSKGILLSDAPADLAGDLLWQETDIGFDLEMVCSTITNSKEPLVFAVHGPWGSGKTSFLRMVEDRLHERITDEQLFVSWYVASTYQSVGDVATTLTLRILRTLSGRLTSEGIDELYTRLLRPQTEAESKMTETYEFMQRLAGKVGVLADLGVVIDEFLNGAAGSGKGKLVLMIDDLDRCSLDYIGDLLETIQRLSSVKNLFIFLAVDQARLQNALKERFSDVMGERDPRWAREKYIQHTIDLPPLTDDDLPHFIAKVLGEPDGAVGDDESKDLARELILGSVEYFRVAIRNKMPRTIKACINIIRPSLVREIVQHDITAVDPLRKVVKGRLASYLFRDFYNDWLERALKAPQSTEAKFLTAIEGLCYALYYEETPTSDRYARFQFELDRLKSANLLENRVLSIPEELALLLSLPPFFVYQDATLGVTIGLTDKLQELYEESEEAERQKDARTCIQKAYEAYQLVMRNRSAIGGNYTWLVGNLALNAEKFQVFDLAERLHALAVEMDPTFVNVVLNYVDFLSTQRPTAWREALGLISELGTALSSTERARALKLTIMHKVRARLPYDEEVSQMLEFARKVDSLDLRVYYIDALIDLRLMNEALSLFQETAAARAGTPELIDFQAAVAASFYKPNNQAYEFISMDLYRQILAVKKIPVLGYAFLLNKHGYRAEAGCIWFDTYRNFRESFWTFPLDEYAQYLDEADAPALAQRVRMQEDLGVDQPVLLRNQRPLPPRFANQDIPNYLLPPGQSAEPYTCAPEA